MVPRIAKEAYKKSKLPGPLKIGKDDKSKFVELVGNDKEGKPKASVLGMVTYEKDQDFLIVYDSQHFSSALYARGLTFFQTLAVTWTNLESSLARIITSSGSAKLRRLRIADHISCWSLPDTSKCAISIQAGYSEWWK